MAAQWEDVKWVPNTRFIVDGFRYQSPDCEHYFLTHAHGDHTCGLYKSFSAGTIYCTHVTANLIVKEQGIPAQYVTRIDLNKPFTVDGVRITAFDANHCPGACMLLFEVPRAGKAPETVLHTGDFRYHPRMSEVPALKGLNLNTLMLDTTYANPRWSFPSQNEAVTAMVDIIQRERADDAGVIFACNAYHIGKERCYFGAALKCGFKVWAAPRRRATFALLDLPREWLALLTEDRASADLIVNDSGVGPEQLTKLAEDLGRKVVGFRCTGWTYQKSGMQRRAQDGTLSYGIPYSEHSSWTDLRNAVSSFRPMKLIPTVNVSDKKSLAAMVDKFADLMDLSESRGHMDRFLVKRKRSHEADAVCSVRSVADAIETSPLKAAMLSPVDKCATAAVARHIRFCDICSETLPCACTLLSAEHDVCSIHDLSDEDAGSLPVHALCVPAS